jgi:hypothetical protein
MPRDDGRGFHDLHGLPPATPYAREQHPQESVGPSEPKPSRRGLLEDGELVAEGQDLRLEFGPRSKAGPNRRPFGETRPRRKTAVAAQGRRRRSCSSPTRRPGRSTLGCMTGTHYQQRPVSSIATRSTGFLVGTAQRDEEPTDPLADPSGHGPVRFNRP